MRIILNVIGGSGWYGGQQYVEGLAHCIHMYNIQQESGINLEMLVASEIGEANSHKLGIKKIRQVDFFYRIQKIAYRVVGALLPFRFWRLFYFHTDTFFYPTIDGHPQPYICGAWIPDFQHIYMPEMFSRSEIRSRERAFTKMANGFPLVVVSSEMARSDFIIRYPQAAEKVRVLHFTSVIDKEVIACDADIVRRRFTLPKKFFLVSNQFWKHKDHRVIVEATRIASQRGVEINIVCTGAMTDYRNPNYPNEIRNLIKSYNLHNQIRLLGFIQRIDQLQLMRACIAIIQPSQFEGWSTTVEDARVLAKPIILSDFPVHREQSPPMAKFFPVGNPNALADQLCEAILTLRPGPDKEAELKTFALCETRQRKIGEEFIKIVREAIKTHN